MITHLYAALIYGVVSWTTPTVGGIAWHYARSDYTPDESRRVLRSQPRRHQHPHRALPQTRIAHQRRSISQRRPMFNRFTAPICQHCGFFIGPGTCKSIPMPDARFFHNECAPPEARVNRLSLGALWNAPMHYTAVVDAMLQIPRDASLS